MVIKKHTKVTAIPQNCITASQQAFHDTWRSLWEQHVAWTRMTIMSAALNLPDMQHASARLLQNATDMGAALKPVYGDAVASRFTQLIREHLLIAVRLVGAAKQGDTAAAVQAEKEWYANGATIAAFLAGINPQLSENTFRDMFFRHLALTKAEAVAILAGNWQDSVSLYDTLELQALEMADTISGSIMRQYPGLFV